SMLWMCTWVAAPGPTRRPPSGSSRMCPATSSPPCWKGLCPTTHVRSCTALDAGRQQNLAPLRLATEARSEEQVSLCHVLLDVALEMGSRHSPMFGLIAHPAR